MPDKLAPDMASFRLLVYVFVRDYIEQMGDSPSYGEVANHFDTNPNRVKRALKALEREGLLMRVSASRGWRLPSARDAAIRQLRELGFVVDEDVHTIGPPGVTKPTLLPPPELDYKPGPGGDRHGGSGPKNAGGTARRRRAGRAPA